MNQEGAGGDCFGVNEMYLALLAGTNPKTLVLNGSNKQDEELEMAIAERALHQHRRHGRARPHRRDLPSASARTPISASA